MRLLVGTTNVVDMYFSLGETPTDADGPVVVTVTNPDGVVVSTGNAGDASGTGHYTYTIPLQAELTKLKAVWAATVGGLPQTVTQHYEVVGAFLFSLAELRAQEGISGESVTHSPEELAAVRDQVTTLFNDYTRSSFGGAYMRQVLDGVNGVREFNLEWLPVQRILSIKSNNVALVGNTVSASGTVWTTTGLRRGNQNVVVEYVYGRETVPDDVKRAALRLARHWLLGADSSIPERARMMTTEWGSFQLTNATEDFPTGLPEVDAVLNRYNMRLPGFA